MICIYPPGCTDFSDNGLGTLIMLDNETGFGGGEAG